MSNFRIIDAAIDIPGVTNPRGGPRLKLKLSVLNLTTRQITTENVKYISSVVRLLEEDDRFDVSETPAVLHMICKKLSVPVTHSCDIEEETDLAEEFVRDAKDYINFLKFPVAYNFEVFLPEIDEAHIIAKYSVQGLNSFDQIHIINIDHLVNALSLLGFNIHQIIKALKVMIYDFSRFSDLGKKNYNGLDESAKNKFVKEAQIIICHLCPEITD